MLGFTAGSRGVLSATIRAMYKRVGQKKRKSLQQKIHCYWALKKCRCGIVWS